MPWEQLLAGAERRSVPSPGGVVLEVLRWAGDEDLVVLAHAAGFHKELWLPTIEELRAAGVGATVLALDLRGHGRSTEPPDGLWWWDFGRDVLAAVDAVEQAGRRVGVGHSTGAAAVAAAQVHRPGTFDALVLIDPAIMPARPPEGGEDAENPWAAGARRRRERFASRSEALANFATKPVFATWPRPVLELYVDHGLVDDEGEVTLACRREFEANVFSRPEMIEVWDHLPSLGVDVTLVTGERSDTHDPEHAAATAQQAKAAHVRLDGVSHFIPMEAPAAVAAAVAGHLR